MIRKIYPTNDERKHCDFETSVIDTLKRQLRGVNVPKDIAAIIATKLADMTTADKLALFHYHYRCFS